VLFEKPLGGKAMRKTWKKPRIVELAVGLEINSYACAEL
jgi:coenzyme PQQ precursor peptide PqqA